MSELWSAQQCGWLEALGHSVYVQGELPQEQPASIVRTVSTEAVRPARAAPGLRQAPEPAMQPKAQAPSRPRLPDRLHFALIRAAGCNPDAPGVAEVIAAWPTAEQLRGNPAAKRALWPRLRALRRPAPQ
ncbi:MAG TPA: alanine acetyltransferase [Pseudoxanthomonas sp.]|nr:alanine acetyltransferase [Pseudoxanthomonas sp.]